MDAAVESGAELREDFTVEDLVRTGDRVGGIKGRHRNGGSTEERARVVIGADGVHSFVARAVAAPEYDSIPPLATYYYSYYSGFGAEDIEQYIRDYQGAACFATHDGLTLLATVWPSAKFKEVRSDIEGNVRKVHESIPRIADRVQGANARSDGLEPRASPTTSASPMALAGPSSATRAMTRIRSRRKESATLSSTRRI